MCARSVESWLFFWRWSLNNYCALRIVYQQFLFTIYPNKVRLAHFRIILFNIWQKTWRLKWGLCNSVKEAHLLLPLPPLFFFFPGLSNPLIGALFSLKKVCRNCGSGDDDGCYAWRQVYEPERPCSRWTDGGLHLPSIKLRWRPSLNG